VIIFPYFGKVKEKTMTNKKIWLGILVLVLVLGMTACPTDGGTGDGSGSSGDADTWTDVTSLTQMNGTWKGSFADTVSQGGATVKWTTEITMTFTATNATTGTASFFEKVTYSGITDADWNSLKTSLNDLSDILIIDFNNSTHTVTVQMPTQPVILYDPNVVGETGSIDLTNIQINQNGTKIKINDSVSRKVIILTKQ
jgi:hypothetical protein